MADYMAAGGDSAQVADSLHGVLWTAIVHEPVNPRAVTGVLRTYARSRTPYPSRSAANTVTRKSAQLGARRPMIRSPLCLAVRGQRPISLM